MFVYARTYALGLNEKYIIHLYVCSLHTRAKLTKTDRETERQRNSNKAQGIIPHLFSFKGVVQIVRSQLAKFYLNKISK